MLNALRNRMRRFSREEDGLIMTEFLILLPLLIWTFIAMVVFWDAYRTINEAQKASYAVADAVSRNSEVDRAYINGMGEVMELLLGRPAIVTMRISSLQWDETRQRYIVLFSESPGNRVARLTESQALALRNRIPEITHRDSTLLVETWVNYQPAFNIGIPATSFDNFITTRPREAIRICLRETMNTTCT